jgi:hypothetical protein
VWLVSVGGAAGSFPFISRLKTIGFIFSLFNKVHCSFFDIFVFNSWPGGPAWLVPRCKWKDAGISSSLGSKTEGLPPPSGDVPFPLM